MHGSSGPASLYLPLQYGSQLLPPVGCPTGGPTIPATACSFLWMALAGNPSCPWCTSQLGASPGSTQCLAPALARAPDQDQWRTAQLLGLLQMLFLGPGR